MTTQVLNAFNAVRTTMRQGCTEVARWTADNRQLIARALLIGSLASGVLGGYFLLANLHVSGFGFAAEAFQRLVVHNSTGVWLTHAGWQVVRGLYLLTATVACAILSSVAQIRGESQASTPARAALPTEHGNTFNTLRTAMQQGCAQVARWTADNRQLIARALLIGSLASGALGAYFLLANLHVSGFGFAAEAFQRLVVQTPTGVWLTHAGWQVVMGLFLLAEGAVCGILSSVAQIRGSSELRAPARAVLSTERGVEMTNPVADA